MKTILVTTDLSPESQKAFPVAESLAKAFGAKVVLLSVVEDPSQAAMMYAMEFPPLPDPTLREEVLRKVSAGVQALKEKFFTGLTVEATVRETTSAVPQEILRFADSIAADFIVIATHGHKGITHLLLGSTAEKVARESSHPVVIVPVKG